MKNEINLVSCSHVEDSYSLHNTTLRLSGADVLNLCVDCTMILKGRILEDIMGDALKEVFQATVAKEMR